MPKLCHKNHLFITIRNGFSLLSDQIMSDILFQLNLRPVSLLPCCLVGWIWCLMKTSCFLCIMRADGLIRSRKGLCPQPKGSVTKARESGCFCWVFQRRHESMWRNLHDVSPANSRRARVLSQRKWDFQFTHRFLFFFALNFLLI